MRRLLPQSTGTAPTYAATAGRCGCRGRAQVGLHSSGALARPRASATPWQAWKRPRKGPCSTGGLSAAFDFKGRKDGGGGGEAGVACNCNCSLHHRWHRAPCRPLQLRRGLPWRLAGLAAQRCSACGAAGGPCPPAPPPANEHREKFSPLRYAEYLQSPGGPSFEDCCCSPRKGGGPLPGAAVRAGGRPYSWHLSPHPRCGVVPGCCSVGPVGGSRSRFPPAPSQTPSVGREEGYSTNLYIPLS